MPSSVIRFSIAVICFFSIAAVLPAQPVIVTLAGTDLVFPGNGKAATGVALGRIEKVAVDPNDPAGRPVFADPNYHLVFRVETDGSIRVLAGNNVQGLSAGRGSIAQSGGGYSGDNGPATAAALNRPFGVAYDRNGNLYIADSNNDRIRIVNPQGVISTFAGNGAAAFADGPAAGASFYGPTDVEVDQSGNVYVYDAFNYRIRKITPQGSVSTVCGTGNSGTSTAENVSCTAGPLGEIGAMTLDKQGNLFFAELSANRVRKVVNGVVSTVLGTQLVAPSGLAFDSANNLLITDAGNQRIRRLAGGVAGGALTIVAGNGQPGFSGDGQSALNASLHNPFGLAVTPAGIFVADRDNFRLRRIDAQNIISTIAGNGQLIAGQNGVAAPLATLFDPFGVSFDASGAMLIADSDNNILRRMNSDGTLATIAGTGAAEYGDVGTATQVGIFGPFSVMSDLTGNLFEAETNAGLVREITTNKQISTIAGGQPPAGCANQVQIVAPTQAFPDSRSGSVYIADFGLGRVVRRDSNGSCTILLTGFAKPAGLVLDTANNLYVTDYAAGKVWKAPLPNGQPTVIAGGGTLSGVAADGHPATGALLGQPAGITVDSQGNIYFSDAQNGTVRRVSAANGTISTVAGNFVRGFAGDGGPATAASLNVPWGLAFDSSGALYIADVVNNRIRKLLVSTPPSFRVDNTSISLSASSGSTVTTPVAIALTGSITGLLYGTAADQPWLQVSSGSGSMPSTVQISVDPSNLTAGNYTGHVMITAPGANPPSVAVTVNFAVSAAVPSSLSVDQLNLGLSFVAGAGAASRQLTVRNQGSGSADYTVSVSIANGSGWLGVAQPAGSASANTPGVITVNLTPGQLQPGTYTGNVTITSAATNQTIVVPVAIAVAPAATKLVLTQTGLTFQAVAGGGKPLAQTFGILNGGQGSMNWTVQASTLAGGPWLSITPGSGAVATPLSDVSQVTVSVDPSQVPAPGLYFGNVQVNAGDNPQQTVTVQLNVLPAGSPAALNIYPNGLIFTGTQGVNPSSQTVTIANVTAQPVTYSSARLAGSGQSFFVAVPSNGVIAPNQTASIVVQPDFTNVPAGVTQGTLQLAFGNGMSSTVAIVAVAIPAATSTSGGAEGRAETRASAPCTLSLVMNTPAAIFNAIAGVSTPLEAKLDACGSTPDAKSTTVKVTFSNGDSGVTLAFDQGVKAWRGTWTPHNTANKTVKVDITAFYLPPAGPLANQLTLTATLQTSAVPMIGPGFVQNGASFVPNVAAVGPGTVITIIGSQLANGTMSTDIPAMALGGTKVTLAGRALGLLYVSDTQLNAVVPYDLPVNEGLQVLVQRDTAQTGGDVSLVIAPAQPAVFTVNQQGTGQGVILNADTQAVADSNNPVSAGDVVTIFCTGLGAVTPPPPGTLIGPDSPLSQVVNPVTVTIGGVQAQGVSAGLKPGSAGVYLVTTTVPDGIAAGDQVPVVLTVADQTSPPVTMSVR